MYGMAGSEIGNLSERDKYSRTSGSIVQPVSTFQWTTASHCRAVTIPKCKGELKIRFQVAAAARCEAIRCAGRRHRMHHRMYGHLLTDDGSRIM